MARMGRKLQAGLVAGGVLALLCTALVACGSGGDEAPAVETAEQVLEREAAKAESWQWPQGPRPMAQLHIVGMGMIEIELYPELAPKTVANFLTLSEKSFFEGTTFHRVIPGFMVQGGDPLTREDKNPGNDGMGGPGYEIDDEFTEAPHLRGVVAMSNDGRPRSGGSQFFIVQQDALHLNGLHTVFGRVVSGMDVVDRIAAVERDEIGRWGPADRPIENVVVERVVVSRAGPGGAGAAVAGDGAAVEADAGTGREASS
jgi:peptidyl-prolyl cis-trans isomerase B (cyclophilin B)